MIKLSENSRTSPREIHKPPNLTKIAIGALIITPNKAIGQINK